MALDDETTSDRLVAELALLSTMYPDEVHYDSHSHELSYASSGAKLTLRLPATYPDRALPTVITAQTATQDARDALAGYIRTCPGDEEVLDAIIQHFIGLGTSSPAVDTSSTAPEDPAPPIQQRTVAIWLHHLLNTAKRKAALHAPAGVAGVTRPGYPGILVFSGPEAAVTEHVEELRGLRWQAFQVRCDSQVAWRLVYEGVVEVEAVGQVVEAIVEMERREEFLEAMKIK